MRHVVVDEENRSPREVRETERLWHASVSESWRGKLFVISIRQEFYHLGKGCCESSMHWRNTYAGSLAGKEKETRDKLGYAVVSCVLASP